MSQSPAGRHSPCFGVIERSTGRRFLAQRKPLDNELERDIQMHNVLRASPDLAQLHQVIEDNGEAILVYENADRSFLDSLLPPPSARRSLSRSPSAAATACANAESPRSITREEQVQVFVKQLLTALQYMHRRGIAHLDLRPEVILLQDDHLRLADFGQSRRLINGKVMGGTIKSDPEFVSPEVIASETVTLAADMWSVGALTHVLLVGQSPFLGDNDEETLQNVLKGEFKLEGPNSGQISEQAKDFVRRLLISEPFHRLNAEQALGHDWLSDPSLGEAKLSTDCLREFKYHHKWLERRVFVQQTPSDQLTQLVETPRANLCTASSQERQTKADAKPARAEPFAVYDYLRIKEESRPEYARRDFPQGMRDSVGRNLSAPPERVPQRQSPVPHSHSQSPHRQPSPHGQQPPYPLEAPPVPDWIVTQLPPGVKKEQLCWDPYGGGFYLPQQFQPGGGKQGGHQQAPPLPPRSRGGSSVAEKNQSPAGGGPMPPSAGGAPSQLAPLPAGIAKKIEAMAAAAAAQKEQQNQPKMVKSNEAENMEELARQLGVNDLKLEDLKNPQSTLMKLIRGERRQIQDELANRVLSDISEESSIIDSTTQISDRSTTRQQLPKKSGAGEEEEASTTTTAEHEGPSSSTVTPLASPTSTGEQIFPEQEPPPPEVLEESKQHFSSQNLPLRIPPYLDTFPKGRSFETPEQQILAARGIKSPVQRSPGGEHIMSVQIGVGKKEKEEEEEEEKKKEGQKMGQMEGKKEDLAKQKGGADEMRGKGNNNFRAPPDTEFDLLMDAVDRVKQDQQRRINEKQRPNISPLSENDDLERYRPYSIYKEFELDVKRHQMPKDDFAWESHYQIGPETLLVPTIGARFNARVRDYRRGIWGDSASYVMGGELGERNGDVTVRERRRYTDLIREELLVQKSVDNVLEGLLQTHEGALRRIGGGGGGGEGNGEPGNDQMNEQPAENEQTIKNGEKKFAPIFRSRLRDGFFTEGAASVVFECLTIGNPPPEVTFFHHESAICEDGRHQIVRHGNTWRLTVLKPLAGADTGEYSCVAENKLGMDKCVCKCRGGEAPNRPTRPEVELSADTEVYISWEPPERLPVTLEGIHYRLECRPAGEKDAFAAWTIVSNCVEDEAAIVKHLIPLGIYQFRVAARNEFGWGEPSIHSRIIRTHPRGIPKLNLNVLRKEGRRFAILTMPQKSGRKGNGLSEIREGLAEREEEEVEEEGEGEREEKAENGGEQKGEDGTNGGNGNGMTKKVPLNTTEDPLKRFQLESELFRGQFSVIRYAIDSKTGAHCTVKIRAAPSHGSLMFATPAERMKAALVEYETLAECQHENIVQLIASYCSDNSFQLLFTERLHENLFQRFVRLDSYTEEQIAFVARQIVAALKWMHFNGVVHGDVEPTNVMFTTKRSWCVKLVDFGRARKVGSREGLAGDGQLLAEWTAPEILVARMSRNGGEGQQPSPNGGNVQLANPQTDMWGLGLVTFCLLAGYHPFSYDEDSEAEIRRNVLEQRCDPNLIPVQASEEALRFVVWALKKDPSRRMRPDEALGHRWLAADGAMVRRRENIKYNAQRLIRTAERRLRQQCQFARNGNGGGHSPAGPSTTQQNGGGSGMWPRNGEGGNGKGGFACGNRMGGGGRPSSNGQIGRIDQIGGQQLNEQRKAPSPQQQRRKIVSAEC